MAIGILMIMFIFGSSISILGLLLMYLVKNEQAKTILFYVMGAWGMALSAIGALSLPSNFITQQIISWALGFLSVIGLLLHIRAERGPRRIAAYILVTVSVVAGILKIFLF